MSNDQDYVPSAAISSSISEMPISSLTEAYSSSRLRVVVRVRPPLDSERRDDICSLLKTDAPSKSVVVRHTHRVRGTQTDKRFSFDGLLDRTATQEDTFRALNIESLIGSLFEGYNATVFAYGQTGSGKTYTMEGYDYENSTAIQADPKARARPVPRIRTSSQDKLGIIPRALTRLFQELELERRNCESIKKGEKLTVRCSFVQIYNEKVLDLLNPSSGGFKSRRGVGENQGLRLRWSQQRGFYAENLYVVEVESRDDAIRVFHSGLQGKIMASHSMNAASSRSHCIFSVVVQRSSRPEDVVAGGQGEKITSSTLSFVDLAGSEKASQTGATGVTLNESIGINTSLHALRKVIKALADSSENDSGQYHRIHVPYRDSKLTSLLQHAIGGNSITVMVACLSPCDRSVEENLSTLQYASHAQSIENRPVVNVDPTTRLIRRLRVEIRNLKKELAQARRLADVANSVAGQWQIGSRSNNPSGMMNAPEYPDESATSNDTTMESRVRKLKQDLIDNIEMIKTMYQSETRLRVELESANRRADDLQVSNGVLHTENVQLRNQLAALLGDSSHRANMTTGNDKQSPKIVETVTIPGYGLARARALESKSSNDLEEQPGASTRFENGSANSDNMISEIVAAPSAAGGGFFDIVSEDLPSNNVAPPQTTQHIGPTRARRSEAASTSSDDYALSPTLMKSIGSGGNHAILSRPPPSFQTKAPSQTCADGSAFDSTLDFSPSVPVASILSSKKTASSEVFSRAGRDTLRYASLSSRTANDKHKHIHAAYGNSRDSMHQPTGSRISKPVGRSSMKSSTKATKRVHRSKLNKTGVAATVSSSSSGHLSVGALRSLLSGSAKSDSVALASIPGTPGVLARAKQYAKRRQVLDEPG